MLCLMRALLGEDDGAILAEAQASRGHGGCSAARCLGPRGPNAVWQRRGVQPPWLQRHGGL